MKTTKNRKLWSALLALVMLLSLLPVSALADEAEGGEAAPVDEVSEIGLDDDVSLDGDSDWTRYDANASVNVTINGVSVTFKGTGTPFQLYNITNKQLIKKSDGVLSVESKTVGNVSLTGGTDETIYFDTTTVPTDSTKTAMTAALPNGVAIAGGNNDTITGVDNAKVGFAADDILWLIAGTGRLSGENAELKVSTGNNGCAVVSVPVDSSSAVTVTKTEDGGKVTISEAGKSFSVGETTKTTYTAASAGAEFSIGADGTVSLTSGSAALADGDSIVGGGSGKTITNPASSGGDTITVTAGEDKDTVTMSGSINGRVDINSLVYDAAKGTTIEVTGNSGYKLTSGSVGLGKNVGIHVGSLPVINKSESDAYVIVSVSDDESTLAIPESGKVAIGEAAVENPDDEEGLTVEIDADGMLHVEAPVIINGVTYTPVEGSSFPLNGGRLTKLGEKAVVSGGLDNDVTLKLGGGEDVQVVTVPKTNKGETTVVYGYNTPTTVMLAKAGDSFTLDLTVGQVTKTFAFTAGSDNAEFTLDFEDANVLIASGSATLKDSDIVLGGGSGQRIQNPESSGNDEILVTANSPEAGKDSVKVPAGGKVQIGNKQAERIVYEAGKNGVTLVVDSEGNVTVIEGALKGDDDSDTDKDTSTDDKTAETDSKTKSGTVAKTGDESNMALWIAVMLGAGSALCAAVVLGKKKKD